MAGEQLTVTVLPFSSHGTKDQAWLGKGIADMLMQDLAGVDGLIVLERDHIQTLLEEMELQDSAFLEQQAVRVGKVARVDRLVFGNYIIKQDNITIELMLVDLATQSIIQQQHASGTVDTLHQLVSRLALDFLGHHGRPLSEREIASIRFRPTDSFSATEHFYRGIDAYDQGEYADAFSEFVAASLIDTKYHEAQLWLGKMLEYLGMETLAVNGYENLYASASNTVEGYDALLFAATLRAQRSGDNAAVKSLTLLRDQLPTMPHSLEAAFQLGQLSERQQHYHEAYRNYAFIDSFSQQYRDKPLPNLLRQSRFYRWEPALALHRQAVVRMVPLYRELMATLDLAELPAAPRGAIAVTADKPEFAEPAFGRTPSLFPRRDKPLPNWREEFYALVTPPGYVATGIEMQLKGHLPKRSTSDSFTMRVLPFPMPHNYQNTWMGVIYGQTSSPATLKKYIPFYGHDRRYVTLQFIEDNSQIFNWEFKLRLKPESAQSPDAQAGIPQDSLQKTWEGQLIGQVVLDEKAFSGVATPMAEYWYAPRQRLALVNNYQDGLYLVAVKGEPGGEATNLWMSHSQDGASWGDAGEMSINSLGDDFAPQLLRAEDGSIHLFWISNRRGLGWEIWTSRLDPATHHWDAPGRIPLEQFSPGTAYTGNLAADLPGFTVAQDKRGRWLLAYRSTQNNVLHVLMSRDTRQWQAVAELQSPVRLFSPIICEDASGVYRLAAIGDDNHLHLWSSRDVKSWQLKSHAVNRYTYAENAAPHRMHLYGEGPNTLLLIMSDAQFGLQYVRFNPDVEAPRFDLVKDAGLEAYSITPFKNNSYLVAQQKHDVVELRHYSRFQSDRPKGGEPGSIIYSEYATDDDDNEWRRIFARMRAIQPDVTTVNVAPDGRVWWGIETGIMSFKGADFYSADVSQGFFHHHVTSIEPCGDTTAFASRDAIEPVIGWADAKSKGFRLARRQLQDTAGTVTALGCINDDVYIGTSTGEFMRFDGQATEVLHRFSGQAITAITAGVAPALPAAGRQVWIGTDQGHVYRYQSVMEQTAFPDADGQPVRALAVDADGVLWASVDGRGVFHFKERQWSGIAPIDRGAVRSYQSVMTIRPDPDKGVWMLPGPEEVSHGVLYSDGARSLLLNPPDRIIQAPTGVGVDARGVVWIGTAFDGLFRLEPSSL
jgi:TolB-like protein